MLETAYVIETSTSESNQPSVSETPHSPEIGQQSPMSFVNLVNNPENRKKSFANQVHDLEYAKRASALSASEEVTSEDQQSIEQTLVNLQSAHVKNLLMKLSQIQDKNVYVLAEKVEISHANSEDTLEGAIASDFVTVIATVTSLATAIVGLLDILLRYKDMKKSNSKKHNSSSGEDSDEQSLIQISINNHAISIAGFEALAPLAPDIFRQLGIKPREGGDDVNSKPKGVTVVLDPDVAAAFSTPEAINETLRMAKNMSQLITPKQ